MARNILVVEDDRNISDLIRMYLEKEGFDVRIAYDGGKAVEEFDREAPDMVLLDIMLPVMDGWAVCSKIRETSRTPIIMITAKSDPVFGGVYKLVAVERPDGTIEPKIKISENTGKITNPHFKKLYRFYGNDTGKAIADYLCVWDETVDDSKNIRIFDPEATWKEKEVYNFTARELQVPIFRNGKLVYQLPTLDEIRDYCRQQVDTLWDEVKRFDNPHTYYVDLSQRLWDIKYDLLKKNAGGERHE